MTEPIEVITIDGPTASGKGTVATQVAQILGFHYLDSGALFRITAYACLKRGVDLTQEATCAQVASSIQPVFKQGAIFLDEEDVTQKIRAEAVGLAASQVAAHPKVRDALVALEKRACQAPGLVADGRDMGSVVFPQARLKVFLTASAQARALRRYNQLIQNGISANLRDLTQDLEARDRRDRERAVSPLVPASDAFLLDSSEMSVEATVEQVLEWWRQRQA